MALELMASLKSSEGIQNNRNRKKIEKENLHIKNKTLTLKCKKVSTVYNKKRG